MNERFPIVDGVTLWARGWLHGNVVRLDGAAIDSGYGTDTHQLVAWLSEGTPVDTLLLTHVHSDHAGGVAAVQTAFPNVAVHAHRDAVDLVQRWDPVGLWLVATGQALPHFTVNRLLGSHVEAGGRRFTVIETPGHAVGGVSFFDEHDGILATGDALWEDGFGMLVPWFDPPGVFERCASALDALALLTPAVVLPGHGRPFRDFVGALGHARRRLDHYAARPDRLRHQVLKNMALFYQLTGASLPEVVAALQTLEARLPPLPGDTAPAPLPALVEALTEGWDAK